MEKDHRKPTREEYRQFDRETGQRFGTLITTFEHISQLTGMLSIRDDGDGLVVTVPDVDGIERDILYIPTEDPYIHLFIDEWSRKAAIDPNSDEKKGSFIPYFQTHCEVTLTDSSVMLQMRENLENPGEQIRKIGKQFGLPKKQ